VTGCSNPDSMPMAEVTALLTRVKNLRERTDALRRYL
jgi:hypothetical protein